MRLHEGGTLPASLTASGEPTLIYLKALFLAIVEGVTEFLPISSTGHMILVDEWVKLSSDQAFADAFMVLIQLPAILAVVAYFWHDLWPFSGDRDETRARLVLWTKIMAAFAPAAVLGALLAGFIEQTLFNPVTVAVALLAGGVLLIMLERRPRAERVADARAVTYKLAFCIGLAQCVAMVPGTSRSAATIIGAMLLGAGRVAAVEFSFFLAVPTMVGATAFTVLKHGLDFSAHQWAVVAVGSVVSFVVAYLVIAAFMNYIRRRNFIPFGYYRIVLGLLVLGYFLLVR